MHYVHELPCGYYVLEHPEGYKFIDYRNAMEWDESGAAVFPIVCGPFQAEDVIMHKFMHADMYEIWGEEDDE
jgi:hypothetical protein